MILAILVALAVCGLILAMFGIAHVSPEEIEAKNDEAVGEPDDRAERPPRRSAVQLWIHGRIRRFVRRRRHRRRSLADSNAKVLGVIVVCSLVLGFFIVHL